MGTVSLDYGCMEDAESAARKAASSCGKYSDKIGSKVTKKLSSLQGGSTGNTSSSSYFANQKMRSLNAKQEDYIRFADKMKSATKYAKETDKAVSTYIKKESESFRKSHDMNVNKVVEWFTWLSTTIINKTEFGRWIADKFRDAAAWVDDKWHDFKRWYELDGGKYIIKTVLAVVGTVIAVAVLVLAAWPAVVAAFGAIATAVATGAAITGAMIWTAIAATAGFVTAMMTVIDNVTKIYGNTQAYLNNEDDPGWAKRYGGYDSFSEMLRKELFSSDFANKLSYIAADIYDVIGITASIVNFADMAHQGMNFAKTIKEKGVYHIFDKVHFKSPSGKMTWGTFKYGMKHFFNNVKIMKDGIKSTNISRLTKYYKKSNIKKSFLNFEKVYNFGKDGVSMYDKILKDGFVKNGWNTGIEKIRDKTIVWDFSHQIKEKITEMTDLKGEMYKVYP